MEELRAKLNDLIKKGYKLTDSKVVQVSQELDKYVVKEQMKVWLHRGQSNDYM